MSRLRKALALSASDWLLIAQAWMWFRAVEVGLRCLSLQKMLRIIQRSRKPQPGPTRERELCRALPERMSYCVGMAARLHLHDPKCLNKALVLYTLLTRRDFEAQLLIGAAKATSGQLEAHAWLQCQGQILLGQPAPGHYSTLCALPGSALRAPQPQTIVTS